HAGQPFGNRRELQVGSADLVSEVEQHFGDAAHADSSNPRKMQMLLAKKHFFLLLFRLAAPVSIKKVSRERPPVISPLPGAPLPGGRTAGPLSPSAPKLPAYRTIP